jgi:hypothetical protein
MHDENNGSGNGVRFQIWDDPNAVAIYAKYAGIKTQMLPYVKIAVEQARQRGTPVMRHLFLDHPRDPATWTLADEYTYGDSLLVAPVTVRGATSRPVYLPDPAYFDYWTGERVPGGGVVMAPAPLDTIPVFAKAGAIVPMLAPEVETIVAPTDGSVISAATYANFLQVDVFAGGSTSVTLGDGTVLSQSAPSGPFTPGPPTFAGVAIRAAQSEADLLACDACAYDDPASHIWSVSVQAQMGTVNAPPLILSLSGSPTAKRLVFRVRH